MILSSLIVANLALAQPVYETVVETERAKQLEQPDSVVLDPQAPPKTLSEVLNVEPGVQIQSQGVSQFQSFLFHGSSSEDLLVVLDGVIMNDPTAPSSGFDFSLLDPSLIESVRLWPHARGVRWGRGAVSGVLEITLKKKVPAQVGLRAGSDEHLSGHLQSEQLALSAVTTKGPSAAYSPNASLEKDGSSAVSGVVHGQAWDGRVDWMLWGIGAHREYDRLSEAVGDDPNAHAENQNFALQLKTGLAKFTFFDLWRKDHNDPDPASPYFLRGLSKARRAQLSLEKTNEQGWWWQTEALSEWSNVLSEDSYGASQYTGTQNEFSLAALRQEGVLRPGLRMICLGRCEWLPEISLQISKELEWEVRAAQGLKSPSLFQKFSQYGNRSLQAEKRNSFSARVSRPESALGWALEGFWNHADQLIDFDVATSRYFNRKKADFRGATLQGWRQDEKNRVSGSYEFLEASESETGKWLPRRARHNVGLSYMRFLNAEWGLGLDGKYLSERPDVDSAGSVVQQSSQILWDLRAKWQRNTGNVFTFAIINLTDDKRSFIYGYGSGGRIYEIAWDHRF